MSEHLKVLDCDRKAPGVATTRPSENFAEGLLMPR